MKMKSRLSGIAIDSLVFSGLLLLAIFVFIYGVNKGFDFTDEGFILLGYTDNQPTGIIFSLFHLVVKKTFSFISVNILFLRYARLVLLLISTSVFIFGLNKLLKLYLKVNIERQRYFIYNLPLIFLSIFAGYAYSVPTLSYNSITAILLLVCIGVLFISIGEALTAKKWETVFYAIIVGYIIGIQFLVKFTTSIAVFLILIAFIIVVTYLEKNKTLLIILPSMIVGIMVFILTYITPKELIIYCKNLLIVGDYYNSNFKENYSFLSQISHIKEVIKISINYFSFSVAGIFLYHLLHLFIQKSGNRKAIEFFFFFVLILILIYSSYYEFISGYKNASVFWGIGIFTLTYFLFTIYQNTLNGTCLFKMDNEKRMLIFILIFLLFLFPIIGSFGTAFSYLMNILIFLPFLISILFLIELLFIGNNLLIRIIKILTAFILFYFFVSGYIFKPCRTANLMSQNSEVNFGPLKNIKVDLNSKNILTSLNNSLLRNGYQKGDYIISFFNYPGFVYCLEGVIPKGILYGAPLFDLYLENLSKTKSELLESFILLDNKKAELPTLNEKFITLFDKPIERTHSIVDTLYFRRSFIQKDDVDTILIFCPKRNKKSTNGY